VAQPAQADTDGGEDAGRAPPARGDGEPGGAPPARGDGDPGDAPSRRGDTEPARPSREAELAQAWARVVALERARGLAVGRSEAPPLDEAALAVLLPHLDEILAGLAASTKEVVWVHGTQDSQMLWISPSFERVWQIPRAELYRDPNVWMASVHPDDRQRIGQAIDALRAGGDYDETYRIVRRDGSQRWIHDRSVKLYDERGRLKRLGGIAEDVTELQLAIEARIETNQMVLLQLALQTGSAGDDLDESLRRITEAAARCLSLERVSIWFFDDELTTLRCHDLFRLSAGRHETGPTLRSHDYPRYFAALKLARAVAADDAQNDPRTSEFTDGYLRPLGVSSLLDAPVRFGGRLHGVVCHEQVGPPRHWSPTDRAFAASTADLVGLALSEAERRRLEKHFTETQKLESLGVLAGGIAHDFNNLLQGIVGNAELLAPSLPATGDAPRLLDELRRSARRCAELCEEMLAYSGQGSFRIEPVQLASLVREMGELLSAAHSKKCQLVDELGDDLPPVLADRTQLRQVVMNLITNAAEAIGDAPGRITLRGSVGDYTAGQLDSPWLAEAPPPGRYVCLEVADTGSGMDPATLTRIFEPFFTTKFTGRGLGLSALLGIVRAHQGSVQVETAPGQGTCFRLLLPAHSGRVPDDSRRAGTAGTATAAGATQAARAPLAAPAGVRTVLLVDDEDMVRIVGGAMLVHAGCRVLEAADGRAALRAFEAQPDAIDCVLLDLLMPAMDGVQTFRALRAIRPDVPIIVSSGYAERNVAGRFPGEKHIAFLKKPFESRELIERMREARG